MNENVPSGVPSEGLLQSVERHYGRQAAKTWTLIAMVGLVGTVLFVLSALAVLLYPVLNRSISESGMRLDAGIVVLLASVRIGLLLLSQTLARLNTRLDAFDKWTRASDRRARMTENAIDELRSEIEQRNEIRASMYRRTEYLHKRLRTVEDHVGIPPDPTPMEQIAKWITQGLVPPKKEPDDKS